MLGILVAEILRTFPEDVSVWIDRKSKLPEALRASGRIEAIDLGADWRNEIDAAIDQSACVVALWSAAINSGPHRVFLREVDRGRLSGKCIQVTLDAIEDVEIPSPFNFDHIIDIGPSLRGNDRGALRELLDKISQNIRQGSLGAYNAHFYLQKFISQYENFSLKRSQPPIVNAVFQSNLFENLIAIEGLDPDTGGVVPALDYIEQWVVSKDRKILALFGEFGSGKTTICLQYTYHALKKIGSSDASIFPIYIEMSDLMANGGRIVDSFFRILVDRYRLAIHDIWQLHSFCSNWRAVLLLDALDDVSKLISTDLVRKAIADLTHIFSCFEKVVITCRTSFFWEMGDVTEAMFTSNEFQVIEEALPEDHFDLLMIQDLRDGQVEAFVANSRLSETGKAEMAAALDREPRLASLCRRPVLLAMVVQAFAQPSRSGMTASISGVYGSVVETWMRHEHDRREGALRPKMKVRILENIAVWLAESDRDFADRDILSAVIAKSLGKSEVSFEQELMEYEFLTCSFLRSTWQASFGFCHRSVQEYFVARAVVSELAEGSPGCHETLRLSRLSARLAAELISERKDSGALIDRLQAAMSVDPAAGRTTRTAANLATILIGLEVSFSGSGLAGVNLADADLQDADFSGAGLAGAVFDGANCRGADFSGADLRGASFRNAFLSDTRFADANLSEADFWNIRMVGGPAALWRCYYSPASRAVLLGTDDGRLIEIRHLASNRDIVSHRTASSGVLGFAVSNDERWIAISDRDGRVAIHEVRGDWSKLSRPPTHVVRFPDNVRALAFSPMGVLACGCRDNVLTLLTIDSGHLKSRELHFHRGPIMDVAWAADGQWIYSGGYDGRLCVWDPQRPDLPVSTVSNGAGLADRQSVVRCLAISPDGASLVSGDEAGRLSYWEAKDGRLTPTRCIDVGEPVFSLAVLRDGRTAFGTGNGAIGIADPGEDRPIQRNRIHDDVVRSMVVLPGGDRIVTASWDGSSLLVPIADPARANLLFALGDAPEPLGHGSGGNDFAGADIEGLRGLSNHFKRHLRLLGAAGRATDDD